jgi:hypothetical protein
MACYRDSFTFFTFTSYTKFIKYAKTTEQISIKFDMRGLTLRLRSWDSAVDIVTSYGLDGQGVGFQVLVEVGFFSSPCCSDRFWAPSSLLSSEYQGLFPQW